MNSLEPNNDNKHSFGIQLIQDKYATSTKWIVWKKNMVCTNEPETRFINYIGFNDVIIESMLGKNRNKPTLVDAFTRFTTNRSKDLMAAMSVQARYSSKINKHDLLRPFTIKEYKMLGRILQSYGYKYNKKKDEFVKIK